MSPDRVVRTTLVIDERGSVRVLKGVGEEAGRTEHKLSGLDRSSKGLGKTFGGLKSSLVGGLGLVGAGGLAFGLADVVSKTKEVAQETEKFSAITGIGATASLRYTQALKARGLSGESVTKAFGFLAKNVRSAELQEKKFGETQAKAGLASQKQQLALAKAIQGGKALAIQQAQLGVAGSKSTAELGRQAKAFQELGIGIKDFGNLSEEAKLEKITQAFEALPDGMRKTRLERELFGRGGNQLSVVLDKNNLGLSHQIELVKKFYPTLKGGRQGLQELNEKQAESKMAWEGLIFTLGQGLIPVMTKLMSKFSQVVVEVEKGKGPWGQVRKDFEGVLAVIKPLWQGFSSLVGPANALGAALVGLTVLKVSSFSGLSLGLASIARWGAPIIALAAAVHELDKVLPKGERPENLLGGNQPGEALREGERGRGGGLRGFLHRWEAPGAGGATAPERAAATRAREETVGVGARGISGGVQAGLTHSKVELHVDGHKLAETLLQNPRARRQIAEAATIYAHGMAARGHG